jgi:hypothetical protein
MAAMTSSIKKSDDLIELLKQEYGQFKFKPGKEAHWSPRTKTIRYNPSDNFNKQTYGVLHELAHALLGHTDYNTDFQLLKLESEAWHLAAQLAKKHGLEINEDYIQNCLDTYRDWLHRRSTCPACNMHVMQSDPDHYKCHNCQTVWHVSSARFLRPYRKTIK